MTPRVMDRLTRLEAEAAPPSAGKHLVFQVEAPSGTPLSDIIAFLCECGHAIRDEDHVFVMNLGTRAGAGGNSILDLSRELLTEQMRAAAPAGGKWPSRAEPFTFMLDSPRNLQ